MTAESIQRDVKHWRAQAARGAKRGACSMAAAESILAKYASGVIERGVAALDIYNLTQGLPLKSAAVPLPEGYRHAGASDGTSETTGLDGGGEAATTTKFDKVPTILRDQRDVTGSADRDDEIVETVFKSGGYPASATMPNDGLTDSERAQVEKILEDHRSAIGITTLDDADARAADRVFESAGYPARLTHPDPKVRQILSDQYAVTQHEPRWRQDGRNR